VSSADELARLRREELRAASEILGIRSIEHGGHPDGALASVDPELVLKWIVFVIRRERPDVVITFGPEGAPTEHLDHRAISRLATSAFLLAGTEAYSEQWLNGVLSYRPPRLCYVTWPSPELDSPYHTEGQPIHVEIDARPWHAQKRAAFLAHSSQQQHRESFEHIAMTPSEYYFVASGTPAPPGATDLFAGL
jgi:LmbE family N-acetylglucosaminyl deacetylase